MLRHMRRKRITKFRSALKALPYPSWKRKIYILFPMRWVSNVDISLFYLIEIVLLKDQKRNLGPLKKFLPRSQFLKTNDPCRLTSLYKVILVQYPADHVGGKEVSCWGVKLATGLSWKLLLQTREKAVMGKHATWKNSPFLHDLFSLSITNWQPGGAGSREKCGHPSHADRSLFLCSEREARDTVCSRSV